MPLAAEQKQQLHVCVIGAGVCGLISMKICLENGLRVTCYDKSSKYGGLWCYRPDDADPDGPFEPSVMRTTILNTSKELSSFSDFPPPARLPNFMRHTQYMDYIHSYVDKFNLKPHLKLEHEILHCHPEWRQRVDGDGNQIKWVVRVRSLKTNEVFTRDFDRLMVAVGHHNIPYTPTYPGQAQFKGDILHSARLKDILSNERLRDKNVLVVGLGNSACDAANDIALVARKCYVSCHRGQWFIGRYLNSGPYDFQIKNRMYYYASRLLPTSVIDRAIIDKAEERVNHRQLGLKPKHRPSEQVPAINDLFPYRVYTGGIVLKSSIRTFTERGVKFEGEQEDEEHPIDVVVLATGYEAKINFLNELQLGIRSMEHNNELELFLNVLAPKLTLPQEAFIQSQQSETAGANNTHNHNNSNNHNNPNNPNNPNNNNNNNQDHSASAGELDKSLLKVPNAQRQPTPLEAIKSLAFIGSVQPEGSMTVVSELQARYACLVFKGQLELPKMSEMLKHMERTRRMRSKAIRSHSRDQLIGNYVGYMETVSSLIGVRPNLAKLFFKDHLLWNKLMFGPCVPYQYRLSGPGYWPGAREAIMTTMDRVNQGINEGKNDALYKSRKKCLHEGAISKKAAATKDE